MQESEFDQHVSFTLRIELLNKNVLLYRIDTKNKERLIEQLNENSIGLESTPLNFLWFETSLKRNVIVNTDAIVRITFCYDFSAVANTPNSYYDNFNVVDKDVSLQEIENENGEVRMYVVNEEYIPDGIVYHKGLCPEGDLYYTNPMVYSGLNPGELDEMDEELLDLSTMRQFINLIDDDGEESFIPMKQIIVLEVAKKVIFPGVEAGD